MAFATAPQNASYHAEVTRLAGKVLGIYLKAKATLPGASNDISYRSLEEQES